MESTLKNTSLVALLLACVFFFTSATASDPIPVIGFGIIGDSNSDEFRANDNRGGAYRDTTLNWMEQLVVRRGLNFGPWGSWGGPRRNGFEYNWARSGATARSVVQTGQHIGLAQQISEGKISHVFMYYGVNDFNPATNGYRQIYNGSLSNLQVQSKINAFLADTTTALDTLQNAGNVHIVLTNLLSDYSFDPQIGVLYPNVAGRQRVTNAIKLVNSGLATLAASRSVVLADLESQASIYTTKIDQHGFAPVAGVDLNFNSTGNEPSFFSLLDTHIGTVFNGGPLANDLFLNAMNNGYGLDIPFLTDKEIQENAGILAPPPPDIREFTASSSIVAPGGTVSLKWQTSSTLLVSINQNVGSVPMIGTASLSPTTNTTYTLTATGPGGTTTAQIDVEVSAGNSSPQAQNDTYVTVGTLSVNAPGVLENDPDADSLTATLVTDSTNGQVDLATNGSFTYSPDAGFTGIDNFVYAVSDSSSVGSTATVSITVELDEGSDSGGSGDNGGTGNDDGAAVGMGLDGCSADGSYAIQDAQFNVSAGTDRLVLVALSSENNRNESVSVNSVQLGNKTLTEVIDFSVGASGRYNNLHWIGYLLESDIASRSGDRLSISYATTPSNPFDAPKIHYASYVNVDQVAPITSFLSTMNTNTSSLSLDNILNANNGDRIIGFSVLGQPNQPGINTAGYVEQSQSVGSRNEHTSAIYEREVPETGTENLTFTASARTRMAASAIVLNAQ